MLGRVYEYFLSQFASAEGKKGGEFYTPRCVVKLLVEMLEPYRGRVYDPCCGSSGMFVQSMEFIHAHRNGNGNGGKAKADISIYGQESNYTTWRLAKMNLAIRGIDGQIAHGDTFHNDRHPDLKADFILANPPFNISDWGGERLRGDKRWQYGDPPAGNANYAWVQHIVHHFAPAGVAGFVLSNGSMSSNQSGEGEIRKKLIEEDVVDCMVALPGQLFYSTQIPACLWFLARDRKNHKFREPRPLESGSDNTVAIATAAPGGCMARRTAIAAMAPNTDRPAASSTGRPRCSTLTATKAETALPTIADQGWASGEFGTAKTRNAVAPSGAISSRPCTAPIQFPIEIRIAPQRASPRPARRAARNDSRQVGRDMAGPRARRVLRSRTRARGAYGREALFESAAMNCGAAGDSGLSFKSLRIGSHSAREGRP